MQVFALVELGGMSARRKGKNRKGELGIHCLLADAGSGHVAALVAQKREGGF
jgi:hypothetical protein